MKLSEAIHKGSIGKRQIRGMYGYGEESRCAIGMAYEGACEGISLYKAMHKNTVISNLREVCPIIDMDMKGEGGRTLAQMIYHMNDNNKTVDEIIEYVKSVETKQRQARLVKEAPVKIKPVLQLQMA